MMRVFVLVIAFWLATPVSAGGTAKGINWNECYKDIAEEVPGADFRFECAQVRVPLDYSQEHGPVIALALVRIPASDTINYRGSLFVNPGGPGGSGVDFVLAFGPFAQFVFGPVATQYDIIGFDPRGIGRSTGLRCFGNLKQAEQAISAFPFPMEEQEVPLFEAADLLLDAQCDQRGNKILGHTSTANVARDLEYLRNAVGDDRLNFLGLSYGSFLGQTYASLFPDRVGAMVIDGVIDPIAWSNLTAEVPFSVALRSDAGAQATLEEFLRQCEEAGPPDCALAPQAADRLTAVLERLRQAPIPIVDPDTGETFPYLYSDAILDLLLGLYSPFDYPDVARFFAFIESLPDPESLGLARSDMQQSIALINKRGFPKYPNGVEAPPERVLCGHDKSSRGPQRLV